MKRLRHRQTGFGTVEVLVTIVTILALLVVGWAVYHQDRTMPTRAESGDAASAGQESASAEPQPAVAYLKIKEWGITLPLPEAVKDAYYTTSSSNAGDDGLPNTAWLGLVSLNSRGCNIDHAGPTDTASPVGSIIRVRPSDSDPVDGVPYPQKYPNGVTIDGRYYAYLKWKRVSCAPATTLQTLDAAFAVAAKGAIRSTN